MYIVEGTTTIGFAVSGMHVLKPLQTEGFASLIRYGGSFPEK
jgi:hypothetical protein